MGVGGGWMKWRVVVVGFSVKGVNSKVEAQS